MYIVDTRYFREPGTGRPHRVQVVLDDDSGAVNPRKDASVFADLLTWHGDYESPDVGDVTALEPALAWVERRRWGGGVDAYRIARFARMARADRILFVGGLRYNGYDGGLQLDPEPEKGRRYDGIAVVRRDAWEQAMGAGYDGPITPAQLAAEEVKEYDAWARGEVHGYIITAADDHATEIDDGEEIDSCWGFIGSDEYAMAEGIMAVLGERTIDGGKGWQHGYELTDAEFDDAMQEWYRQHGHRPVDVGWPT